MARERRSKLVVFGTWAYIPLATDHDQNMSSGNLEGLGLDLHKESLNQ